MSKRWRRRVAPEPPPVVAQFDVFFDLHYVHKLQKFAGIVKRGGTTSCILPDRPVIDVGSLAMAGKSGYPMPH